MTETNHHFSPRATLAAIGLKIKAIDLLTPIKEKVKITQKTIKHDPFEKLQDALITILAGAHRLVEINTRLRSDPALQRAFGRDACADQSVVQATLNACASTNVAQMMLAMDVIMQQHSLAFRHDFISAMPLIDIDLTGLPCGKKCEDAAKGYQAEAGIRWGRQLGRVIAAQYEEIVIDRLYPGNLHLTKILRPLVEDLEKTLDLDEEKKRRTIIRMDAGGGSVDEVNWLLERGYQIHGKDVSAVRVEGFAPLVKHWVADPKHPHRQMGWVEGQVDGYLRPVKRLIMRWPPMKEENRKKKPFHYACLLSTLEPEEVIRQLSLPAHTIKNKDAVAPRFAKYGALRIVRDLFHVSGLLEFSGTGDELLRITLNKAAPLVREIAATLAKLLAGTGVEVKVGAT
jgi:hypothetical protein